MPILVLALVQSTWTMLAVLAVRPTSVTALEALLSVVLVVTQRMLECDVKVCTTLLTKCNVDFSLINSVIWSCSEEAVYTYWLVQICSLVNSVIWLV